MIKNLSQFKKAMVEGKEFRIIEHMHKPEYIGQYRKPNKVQTNGMYTVIPHEPENPVSQFNNGLGSWIEFGKAGDYEFYDNNIIKQYFRNVLIWAIQVYE